MLMVVVFNMRLADRITKLGNDFVGGLVAHLLDDRREVFGRYVELVGIEVDTALLCVILFEQGEKFPQDILLPRQFGFVALFPQGEDAVEFQGKGRQQEAYDRSIGIALVAVLQKSEIFLDDPGLVGHESGVGVLGYVGADGEDRVEVDKGIPLFGRSTLDGKVAGIEIVAAVDNLPHRFGIEEGQTPGGKGIFREVDLQGFLPLGAEDNGELIGRYGEICIVGSHGFVKRDGNKISLLDRVWSEIDRISSLLHTNFFYVAWTKVVILSHPYNDG